MKTNICPLSVAQLLLQNLEYVKVRRAWFKNSGYTTKWYHGVLRKLK